MRLWHIDLIPYLPNSQLIAQWRELNSIYKKQDNHILINYIYNYDKAYLLIYSNCVLLEMEKRGFRVKSLENFFEYFSDVHELKLSFPYRFTEHDKGYLAECFFNLAEKYQRGQKDFDLNRFKALCLYIEQELPALKDFITLVQKRRVYANGKCLDDSS